MIAFSFLMEAAKDSIMVYNPKHPFLYYGTILGTGLAGGLAGYNIAHDAEIRHPAIGTAIGAVNGLNLGTFGAEYLDRKLRESKGRPYDGPRTMADAGNELLIKTALGNIPGVVSGVTTGGSNPGLTFVAGRLMSKFAPFFNAAARGRQDENLGKKAKA